MRTGGGVRYKRKEEVWKQETKSRRESQDPPPPSSPYRRPRQLKLTHRSGAVVEDKDFVRG